MAVSVFLSTDLIADQLGRAVSDVLLEEQFRTRNVEVPTEAISALSDRLVDQPSNADLGDYVGQWGTTEQVAALKDVGPFVTNIVSEFRTWVSETFSRASDKLTALAQKILELSQQTGKSIEELLTNLYRRVITALIQLSVPPPMVISGMTSPLKLAPKTVEVSYTLKPSFSIPTDLASIVKFLSDMASMELGLCVKLERQDT